MELTRDLTAEQVDFTQEKKILSDIAQEAREQDAQFATYSEDELFEKVEAIFHDNTFFYRQYWLFQQQGKIWKSVPEIYN